MHGSNFLNAINEHGLLTFSDFHFLLLLMSTPTRYLDMIFHGFDISADGSVEAKVTCYMLLKVCPKFPSQFGISFSLSISPSVNVYRSLCMCLPELLT